MEARATAEVHPATKTNELLAFEIERLKLQVHIIHSPSFTILSFTDPPFTTTKANSH
jgi:hypothetical protein